MKRAIFVLIVMLSGCGNASESYSVSSSMAPAAKTAAPEQGYHAFVAPQQQRVTRGMLFRGPQCCQHRAQAIAVRVTHPQYGPSSFAYSGQDGMYYLYNVPVGDFTLEIWLTNNERDVQRYQIKVGPALVNDIPPIRVP